MDELLGAINMNKGDKLFGVFALAVVSFYAGAFVEGHVEHKQNAVIPLAANLRNARTYPEAKTTIMGKYVQTINQDLAYTEFQLSTEEEKALLRENNLRDVRQQIPASTPSVNPP
jgi:hypothetical protein